MAKADELTPERVQKKLTLSKRKIAQAEFEKLQKKEHKVDAKRVLELARNPKHPLHQCFVLRDRKGTQVSLWRDAPAAERYRLHYAHMLINAWRANMLIPLIQRRVINATSPKLMKDAKAAVIQIRSSRRQLLPSGRTGKGHELRSRIVRDNNKRAALVRDLELRFENWLGEASGVGEVRSLWEDAKRIYGEYLQQKRKAA